MAHKWVGPPGPGEESLGTYGDNAESLGTYGDNWQTIQTAQPPKEHRARAAGYSWDEIDSHMARSSLAAANMGYTQEEIDDYLGYKSGGLREPSLENYRQKWASAFGDDPELFQRYEDTPFNVNLQDSPSWKQDYIEALNAGTAKGPLDFAYDYAAELLNAMTAFSGSPIPLENDRLLADQKRAAALAAEALAAEVPHPRELTDTALTIGGQFDKTRQNVMDEWARSGYKPTDIAIKASVDDDYRGQIIGDFIPGYKGSFVDEVGKGVIRGAVDLASGVALVGKYAWDAVNAVDKAFGLEDTGEDFKGYIGDQVKVWADREKRWKEDYAAGKGIKGVIGGTLGSAMPSIAGLVAAGVPAMIAYASMAGAARAYRDTNSLPAAATGAAVGAFAMGAPVPFLKGAIGRGMIDGAVYGALGIGSMSALQTVLDPLPKYVAGQGYEPPTAEQAAGAFIGGAVLGSLVGTFGAATRPVREVVDFNKGPKAPPEYRSVEEVFKPVEPARREPLKPEDPPGTIPPFVDDATPAAKLEALVQEHIEGGILPRDLVRSPEFQAKIAKLEDMRLTREGIIPDEFDRPNFFSNLAKDMDQPTKDLAAGYDATAASSKFFKQLYQDILGDESGVIKLPDTVRENAETFLERRRANIAGKEIAELAIRAIRNGKGDQRLDVIADSMEPFYKLLAPHRNEFLQELIDVKQQGYMYGPPRSMIMKAINDYETGGLGGVDKNNAIYPFLEHYSLLSKVLEAEITKVEQADQIPPTKRIENYIQHVFKPDKLGKPAGASAGKLGSTGWMRERRIPTTWEALQEGYEMRYPHFIEHVLASVNTHFRTLETYQMLDALQKVDDGAWAYWSTEGPKRPYDKPLYGLGTKKLAMDEKTGKFAVDDMNRNIELQLYAQSGMARTWNNMANWETFVNSSGAVKGIFDQLMRFKNVSTRFKLFFPFFHMQTVYKQGMNIGVTSSIINFVGGLQGIEGRLTAALKDIANVPWAPFKMIYQSKTQLEPMYKSLMNDPTMKALVKGGASMLHGEVHGEFYESGRPPTYWTDYKRGELYQRYTPWEKPGAVWTDTAKLPLRALSQLAVSLNAPVWHQGIPALKNAAGYKLMDTYLKTHPSATKDQIATASRQISELVDSRLGMAKSENLFWRPVLKQITGVTLLSQLWKYGTIQSTMAGLGWRMGHGMEWNPFATYNLAAQLATVAFTNAAWSLLIAGKLPTEVYDYLIPFATARAAATLGTRIMIPGEEKEYHDWWRIVAHTYATAKDFGWFAGASEFAGGVFKYGKGALAPYLQAAIDFVFGEDAIGHDIRRRPNAMVSFLKNAYGPIFWTGMDQADLKDVPQWQNILGIRNVSSLEQDFGKFLEGHTRRGQNIAAEELRRALKEKGVDPAEIKKAVKEYRKDHVPPKKPKLTPNSGTPGSFQYAN